MIDTKKTKKLKGRPKTFDRNDALDKALAVFCEHGYQGTSIAELSAAMGLNPPSIYNAFGDKEHLFIEVLDHYHAPYEKALRDIFDSSNTTLKAFKRLFQMSEEQHSCSNAMGCLIANSGINRTSEACPIGDKIQALHELNESLLYMRLKRGQDAGDIPKTVNIRKLSRYVHGVLQGAAVTARGQRSPSAVKDILEQGYKGFLQLIEADL